MLAGHAPPAPRTIDDLVGPRLAARLETLDVASRKLLAGTMPGERRSKRRGRSVEFDDFRPYTPGDDLRHVDWNIVGRLDRLFVKVFREEEDLSLHVVLDASPSMDVGVPNKLHAAARLAFALCYIGLAQRNRVGLTLLGLPVSEQSPGGMISRTGVRGKTGARRLGEALLGALAMREQNRGGQSGKGVVGPKEALAMWSRGRPPRGVVVLISDMLWGDEAEGALGYLTSPDGAIDAWALQVLSPGEVEPGGEQGRGLAGDVRLVDVETGKGSDVTVTEATINAYRLRLRAWLDATRARCQRGGIAYAMVRSDEPLEDLVTSTLRRGGMLR